MRVFKIVALAALLGFANSHPVLACDKPASVCHREADGSFALIRQNQPATVLFDESANPAIRHVAANFAMDLERVSGAAAAVVTDPMGVSGPVVFIGVLGQSAIIDALVASGKVRPGELSGLWEAFHIEVVDNPWPNVPRALVIVGSDRRGAVFGTYDISERIGVSPWYWWADVPVKHQSDVFITAGSRDDRPYVKYRGFFINDEAPSMTTWVANHFDGWNADMYEHMFELLLRLKGNYLWPAMWTPRAFNVDDPRNTILADEMGVVMGTSHHEPLTRAHAEWHLDPSDSTTGGAWNYNTNAANLRKFWRGGIERMMSKGNGEPYENLVTIGMRGDGDEAMSEGTAISLLESVVADQRKIIADVTGKPASETPQIWALYKEVQDYYDRGMTVPDDVTLLFADDNWGQIRRLPTANIDRPGGFGVYYHFDYVGAPRNSKWINHTQIQKVWQQMDLAYERNAREIWIVNVGDLKPMEYPLDFFLRMAWDPPTMDVDALARYPREWAAQTFGSGRAGEDLSGEIADLITTYSKYASVRTAEWLSADSFPIGEGAGPVLNGGEFGQRVADWRVLVESMRRTKERIRPDLQSAYYQLIEYPILAFSNLYEMYFAAAWNKRLAERGDPRADYFAEVVDELFEHDSILTARYHSIEGGKWSGMMSQAKIGYTYWQEPPQQTPPAVTRVAANSNDVPHSVKINLRSGGNTNAAGTVIDASSYDRNVGAHGVRWTPIPHLGQSAAAIVSLPQGRPSTSVADSIRVEYAFEAATDGNLTVAVHLSPTLDTRGEDGIQLGVSLDDGPVQVVTSNMEPTAAGVQDRRQAEWVAAVINNVHVLKATFSGVASGRHTLKLWRLDDNIVIEQLIVEPTTD